MRNILLVVSLFFCIGCSKKEPKALFSALREEFHREVLQEYGMQLLEERLMSKGDVQRVALDYALYEEGDLLRARLLIHRVAETLLAKMAAEENFSTNNVEITISFLDPTTKRKFPFMGVAHVSLLEGWIHYTRFQPTTGEIELMHREEFATLLEI